MCVCASVCLDVSLRVRLRVCMCVVYLDAVTHPRCINDPKVFEQEGWHYELDSPEVFVSVCLDVSVRVRLRVCARVCVCVIPSVHQQSFPPPPCTSLTPPL